ncbi:MAG: SDR family NAD(P)-dependent oxidoreductase, partial [Myxococcota bacterium]
MTIPLTAKLSSVAPPGRLKHKSVVLTGAGGNIGRYIARQLLKEGARVIITGRTEKTLVRFVRELAAEGVEGHRVVPVAADSANPDDCRRVMAEVEQRFGRLDVLINNAGGTGPKRKLTDIPFTEGDRLALEESETMLDATKNLLGGPWHMTRAAVPVLAPGASVINVSTIFSRTPYFGRIPYVVPKAGLNALSEGLAAELGDDPRGIRVNLVFPGPIESARIDSVFSAMDGLQSFEPGTTSKHFKDMMLLRRGLEGTEEEPEGAYRYPKPQDVASTVLWLATDESAAFSGHSFEVTNGMQVPVESRSELVSWPDKRLVDLRDWVVLVVGGRDISEAMAFSERHASHAAHVVLAFRTMESLESARRYVQTKSTRPMHLMLMDPERSDTVDRTLRFVNDHFGRLDGAIILPEGGADSPGFSLSQATDTQVEDYLRHEIVAPVAVASALAKRLSTWTGLAHAPAITFVTRSGDSRALPLHQINRAAVEQLIRVWRCEEEHAARTGAQQWACQPNQIVRFDNAEEDGLEFCAAWSSTLTNRVRKMDAINLWVPKTIRRSTGKSSMPMSIQRVLPGLHQGKTAVITGGSVGIGLQLGRFLSLAGVRVLLSARDLKKLDVARQAIVEELALTGFPQPEQRVHVLADVDVGNEASLDRLFTHAVTLFGRVDMLINNAGIAGAEEMVVDMGLEDWKRTLEANLISNYSLIRKFAPLMKANKHGKILNVSSYFGGEKYLAVPYPNRADYSVSKAGQRALAEIMSRHLGPEIQINALAPGPVDGLRLRGTDSAPGLFERRGRLILGNKRLNLVHAAVLDAVGAGHDVKDVLTPPNRSKT